MIRFLLDEHLRGPLSRAIQRHNRDALLPIDVLRVGESDDLPLGTGDPEILKWCAKSDRILVSLDKKTAPTHLENLSKGGLSSPGILLISKNVAIPEVVQALVLIAYAGSPEDYRNTICYIP